jgi:hypothetical protein
MKFQCSKYRTVLTAIVLIAMAGPEAVTQAKPFKGLLEGSFTVTPVPPFPPQSVDVLVTATGRTTQLGRFTAVFPARVNISTVPSTAVGTYTFTAANGDTLIADSIGQAVQVAPNLLYIVDNATIVGGTGRFAHASGEFVIRRLADQVNFTTVGAISGTIHTGAKGK